MPKLTELNLRLKGMHCASCVYTIEKGLAATEGIKSANVNLALASAKVTFSPETTSEESVIERVRALGYEASVGTPDILTSNQEMTQAARKNMVVSFLLTLPLMTLAMVPMWFHVELLSPDMSGILQAVLSGLVLFAGGRSILLDAFKQARNLNSNMNTLITMGTLTAFGWSLYCLYRLLSTGLTGEYFFDSAAMIITLILLGRYLEARSKGKASEAVRALMQLSPGTTTAVINGVEIEIDSATVQPGMILLVKPGERVAADGKIIEGSPVIDESMISGESVPVQRGVDEPVIGGTLNGNVAFRMQVTASGSDSFLAGIIRLVSDAQTRKAPVQRLADRVASVFVPSVLAIALITFGLWFWLAPESPMLIKSVISVLIIACPCALGLATPTAILAATGRAAKEGIIVRGGDTLEEITRIDTVLFDKTGTLTHGELTVVEIESLGSLPKSEILRLAVSAEANSEHPLAQAIEKYATAQAVTGVEVSNAKAIPGFGLEAELDGNRLLLGNGALMEREGVEMGQSTEHGLAQMKKGRTVIYVAYDGTIVGLIAATDRVRSEARSVIAQLKDRSIAVTMVSGDNAKTVSGLAESLGIENYESEIRPEQKQLIVESLSKAGFKVAMVGDGINDAPALARADVGIAIGSGTDIALESADVILVRSELGSLIKMFAVSSAAIRIIRQNLFWAFFYNVAAIPLAAGLFYPWFGLSLSPVIAAAAMAFSSIFVVMNSVRLTRLELN